MIRTMFEGRPVSSGSYIAQKNSIVNNIIVYVPEGLHGDGVQQVVRQVQALKNNF